MVHAKNILPVGGRLRKWHVVADPAVPFPPNGSGVNAPAFFERLPEPVLVGLLVAPQDRLGRLPAARSCSRVCLPFAGVTCSP